MTYYIIVSMVTSLVGFLFALLLFVTPAAVIGFACLVGAIGMIGLLMIFLSVWKFWEGKNEFGPGHDHDVKTALSMIIVLIIMVVIMTGFSSTMGFMMVFSKNIAQTLVVYILVISVIGIIESILWGFILMTLAKQFMTPEENGRAYVAIILMVLGSVVSMAIMMYIFSTTNIITMSTSSYMSYIGGIFSIIGYLVFYQIYRNILAKFISGQIKPPPPVTTGFPPGPVPMGPVYGPPPGYPPTYPV